MNENDKNINHSDNVSGFAAAASNGAVPENTHDLSDAQKNPAPEWFGLIPDYMG